MRVTIGRLLAATLLTVCVGVQALEATGRWDRTFQDAGDEAVVVAVVLCIGAALLAAAATRHRVSPSAVQAPMVAVRQSPLPLFIGPACCPACRTSPPPSLRI